MNKKIFFIIIVSFIFSCNILNNQNKKKTYFEFNKENKHIKIPVLKKTLVSDKKIKFYKKRKYRKFIQETVDTSEILIAYSSNSNSLDFMKLDTIVIKQIFLPKISRKLYNFKYINNDSIILQYDRNEYERYDSSLMLINDKGKILKAYSLKGAGVYTSETPEFSNNDMARYLIPNFYEPLMYKKNKIFLLFNTGGAYLGDPAYSDLSIAGYIDMKENKYYNINLKYPDIKFDGKHLFPGADKRFFSIFAHDGDILYAFKYTPDIVKYNPETGKSTIITLKSSVFDTIYSFSSEKDFPKGLDFDMPYPKYYLLKYDSKSKKYFRNILLPADYGIFKFISLIADTSFNVFAEGFSVNTIYKDGFNQDIIKKIKSFNNRKIINKPLTDYTKKLGNITDNNYTAVFFWIDGSCSSVQDGFLTYFKNFKNFCEENNTYLFLMVHDVGKLKTKLKTYNLSPDNHIFIDSTYEFGAYTNYEVLQMPRVIKVRKNKIINDTTFEGTPEGAKTFQQFVYSATKEQKTLNKK